MSEAHSSQDTLIPASTHLSTPPSRVTWPDVALAAVREVPIVCVVGVVALLGVKGTINAEQGAIGIAIALLGRSRPPESPRSLGGAALGFASLFVRRLKGLG